MTKNIVTIIGACLLSAASIAQENVYPAPEYKGLLFLKNATVHVGNGQVLENTTIQISNGKIEKIGQNLPIPMDDVKVFDVSGKHVYPGLILSNSQLGLVEVNSVRATIDHSEIGDINPSIRSIVAYNTDSKVINTLKTNGILMANIVPGGGLISGSSSVVQLDAWNWEDAAVKMENGIHLRLPSLINRPNPFAAFFGPAPAADPVKRGLERIDLIKAFFREAQAYANEPKHTSTNLKFEAVKGLFNKSQKLFVHCDIVKEMLVAIDFAKEFGMDVVIMGGSESWQMADLLKQNNIAVVLAQMHSLPTMMDDDVDQPYKSAVALQKAGVLYAINDEDGQTRGRNLAFNAGTSVAYGLTKEQALQAITLNAAKILGVEKQVGSIEVGKDASLIVSEGDILDIRSSIILHAFIQGRKVDLTDKHKQLDERYRKKYGLTK
ncbi:amidohydrolase family protein [Flavihumibacter sp. UBA7668]|uniref:amidohydrolase family protein n=1 Tax=Flavihumibacter sp. UBA7668 TaxID=1946542 RepID=UPI0025BB1253|nr:amidohydrolase family protein [Flavihumibacter sp. UBA7668]